MTEVCVAAGDRGIVTRVNSRIYVCLFHSFPSSIYPYLSGSHSLSLSLMRVLTFTSTHPLSLTVPPSYSQSITLTRSHPLSLTFTLSLPLSLFHFLPLTLIHTHSHSSLSLCHSLPHSLTLIPSLSLALTSSLSLLLSLPHYLSFSHTTTHTLLLALFPTTMAGHSHSWCLQFTVYDLSSLCSPWRRGETANTFAYTVRTRFMWYMRAPAHFSIMHPIPAPYINADGMIAVMPAKKCL